jgi:hypothetical protein
MLLIFYVKPSGVLWLIFPVGTNRTPWCWEVGTIPLVSLAGFGAVGRVIGLIAIQRR